MFKISVHYEQQSGYFPAFCNKLRRPAVKENRAGCELLHFALRTPASAGLAISTQSKFSESARAGAT
uniref:Uncharacterized protein n=1 Tax=Romanomermis culicivorax TaxID=13658 RepID=A0A915IDR8_ROMCU